MRSRSEVLEEYLELQIEQNEVILQVAIDRQFVLSWHDTMARGEHRRDEHRLHWNSDLAGRTMIEYENKARKSRDRFETNQKKLRDLKDELVAIEESNNHKIDFSPKPSA